MLTIFRLQCKELFRFLPVLIALALLQCVLGQMAAVSLRQRSPEINVGYFVEKHSYKTERYLTGLMSLTDVNMIEADDISDREELFNTGKIQAFVVLLESFDSSLVTEYNPVIRFYRAPGATGLSIIEGHLVNQWLLLRTEELAASYLGEDYELVVKSLDAAKNETPVVSLEYEGPLLQDLPYVTPPAFGIPALFLLLAFLHSASFAVGRDRARWQMRGRTVSGAGTLLSMLTMFLFWGSSVMLYVLGMWVIYQITVPVSVICALPGLAAYAISAGGLLAYYGKRQASAWIFVPWLLLNMTIGGGLWNAAEMEILLPVLLPVSAVLSSGTGNWSGAGVLWAQTAFILLFICAISQGKLKAIE